MALEIKDFEEQLQEITAQVTSLLTKDIPKLTGRARIEVSQKNGFMLIPCCRNANSQRTE
jgi:hypothetical protein